MIKVYLVLAGWRYEGFEILFVASSLEKAKEYETTILKDKYDYTSVEEYEIDRNYDL